MLLLVQVFSPILGTEESHSTSKGVTGQTITRNADVMSKLRTVRIIAVVVEPFEHVIVFITGHVSRVILAVSIILWFIAVDDNLVAIHCQRIATVVLDLGKTELLIHIIDDVKEILAVLFHDILTHDIANLSVLINLSVDKAGEYRLGGEILDNPLDIVSVALGVAGLPERIQLDFEQSVLVGQRELRLVSKGRFSTPWISEGVFGRGVRLEYFHPDGSHRVTLIVVVSHGDYRAAEHKGEQFLWVVKHVANATAIFVFGRCALVVDVTRRFILEVEIDDNAMLFEVFLNSRELFTEAVVEDILACHESIVEVVVRCFHIWARPSVFTAARYPDAGITLRVELLFSDYAERMGTRTVRFKNRISNCLHFTILGL